MMIRLKMSTENTPAYANGQLLSKSFQEQWIGTMIPFPLLFNLTDLEESFNL